MSSLSGSPLVDAAVAAAATERERYERLWEMTPAQRVAAFYRSEFSLGECFAWAARHPHEPPLAADGEYLFIAVRTPEWADIEPARRNVAGSRSMGRGL